MVDLAGMQGSNGQGAVRGGLSGVWGGGRWHGTTRLPCSSNLAASDIWEGQDVLGQERHQEAASSGEVRNKRGAIYALGITMSGPYCTDKLTRTVARVWQQVRVRDPTKQQETRHGRHYHLCARLERYQLLFLYIKSTGMSLPLLLFSAMLPSRRCCWFTRAL